MWLWLTRPFRRRAPVSNAQMALEIKEFLNELKLDSERINKMNTEKLTMTEAIKVEDELHKFYFKYVKGK